MRITSKVILIISFICLFNNCKTRTENSETAKDQKIDSIEIENHVIEKPVRRLNTLDYNIKNEIVNSDSKSFKEIIKKLPTVGNNFHIRIGNEKMKTVDSSDLKDIKAIKLPDSLIYSLSDTIKYLDLGTLRKERPLQYKQEFLDSINSSTDITIYFYFLLDLNNDYYNIFSSVNEVKGENIRFREWSILTFDKSYSLLSKTIRTDNFYIINDTIHSIWWNASDPECLYEKWRVNLYGQLDLFEYEETLPIALKNYSKEFNETIDNNY